jgi:hypothetical protein
LRDSLDKRLSSRSAIKRPRIGFAHFLKRLQRAVIRSMSFTSSLRGSKSHKGANLSKRLLLLRLKKTSKRKM